MGEISIEIIIFFIITVVQVLLLRKLYTRIRTLEGFLLICANCKKIKNQEEQWEQIEQYITEHSHAQFSHGICPECTKKLYPDFYNEKIKKST
jgi:Fe2+ or Zn2+ uptake regulation protein